MTQTQQINNPVRLSAATLDRLPRGVPVPQYDRAALTPGIVHIGLGNFHRAHQAWYLHRLMEMGLAHDWAIIGAGVRETDARQREVLASQDFLTTLISLDPRETSAEVTGAMIGFVPIEPDNAALIAQMRDPAIRIVATTVTEGGYYIDPATKGFDANHPDIIHDAENPDTPRTAFGAIVAALRLRRADGNGPFTCLCCDNLQGNGKIMRQTVVSLARLSDPDLATWIDSTCRFPNSMVDCIVPATGPNELALVQSLGIDDRAPVTHEQFRQWVIEDDFCAGRPDWDKVGAVFTDDVHHFEAMKIRVLNGGHQILANAGEILGVATISGCMSHPQIAGLFDKVARTEILPHLAPVPDTPPEGYLDLIKTRFANPRIVDTTRRVAFDGSSRHPGFLVPSIRDGIAAGQSVDGLALVEALWARMCVGTREDGSIIAANDPFWDALQQAALAAQSDPGMWIGQRHLYGDLTDNPAFAEAFARWLKAISAKGVVATIDEYLAG